METVGEVEQRGQHDHDDKEPDPDDVVEGVQERRPRHRLIRPGHEQLEQTKKRNPKLCTTKLRLNLSDLQTLDVDTEREVDRTTPALGD